MPTVNNIGKIVENDSRNRLAFVELEHFEKTGTFLYKHPLLLNERLTNDLEQLRRSDPERFTTDLINVSKNVTRYTSLIKNQKYSSEQEKMKWLNHIEESNNKREIMTKLMAK